MIDLKKPRHLVKDRLTCLKTYNGKEELTPCGLCYENNNCNKNPSECWELDVYEKLKSYEDDYLGVTMIDLKKPRLTEKYDGGFGLVKVKDDEQEVESPYPNTLKAILECFERLGELENAIESGELVPKNKDEIFDGYGFYYCESEDSYLLGKRVGNLYYAHWHKGDGFVFDMSKYLPWGETVDGFSYSSEPYKIDSDKWFKGFLKQMQELCADIAKLDGKGGDGE